jgi:F0F1-type ATP synthase membrane subunit a
MRGGELTFTMRVMVMAMVVIVWLTAQGMAQQSRDLPSPMQAAIDAITDLLAKTQRDAAMYRADIAGLKAQIALEHQFWDNWFATIPKENETK